MRICLTSLEENKHAKEIEDRIKEVFKDKNYSVVVVPNRYEKEMDKIKKYHKEYYQKNRERIVQEQRDRRERQKLQKEIDIVEEYIGIPKEKTESTKNVKRKKQKER